MKSLCRLMCVLLAGSAVAGGPTLFVTPGSIDRYETGDVTITVSGITGAELRLSLLVDVNQNGAEDPEDYLVWADVVPDNVVEWSPVMFADTVPTAGDIVVDVRLFTPTVYPYTVGSYLWKAEDDVTSLLAPFSVTQLPAAQAVSGVVRDDTLAPVGGAIVWLFPFSEECDLTEYATLTDATGNYTIEFPDGPACAFRVPEAVKPGFITTFGGTEAVEFTGSDRITGVDLELMAGVHAVDGSVVYSSGARVGEGIPGQFVFAESDDDTGAVAFTGFDGGFALTLVDGDWEVGMEDEIHLALQGAVQPQVQGEPITVSGGSVTVPDLAAPASNAVIRGFLFDDAMAPQAGREIEARNDGPCGPVCHDTAAITATDGSFVIAVLAPAAPDSASYGLGPHRPLPHLVGERRFVDLSEGDDLVGQDVEHLTPTNVVFGRFTDTEGDPVGDICLRGFGSDSGVPRYVSLAEVDCDGTYALPVVDGMWHMRKDADELFGPFRGLDPAPIDEMFVIAGADEEANYIIGRWLEAPTLFSRDPASGAAGDHVVLQGFNFAAGSTPSVTIDGMPATVLVARNDIGRMAVEVPAGLTPGVATITLTNPDVDMSSNDVCFEITAGTFTPACSISGTVTRNAGSVVVENALIAVLDEQTEELRRVAISDATGNWSADLADDAATYSLIVIPPEGLGRVWGFYPSVACSAVQGHNFTFGRQLSGRVVDGSGSGVPNVPVDAEGALAFANVLTGANGFFLTRMEPDDTVDVFFGTPHGSRFVNDQSVLGVLMDGAKVLPPVQLDSGDLFAGHVVDKDGNGVQAFVSANERSDIGFIRESTSNSCTGGFTVALQPNEYQLTIGSRGGAEAEVRWIETDGDEVAEFDFQLFDDTVLQNDGPEPRISEVDGTRLQIGQAVRITVENLASSGVEVFFSASDARSTAGIVTVPGDATLWDPGRGQVLTRIPDTAVSGELFVQVQGTDTAPFPFTVDPAMFDPGTNTISGTVTAAGLPVENALVLLFRFDPSASDCDDDDDLVHDYALTDAAGSYALMHPGGDLQLLVFPPIASTLQPFEMGLPAETGDRPGFDVALVDGMELSMRLVAGTPPAPVPNALVFAELGDLPDLRMTDSNGEVAFRFPAGQVYLEVLPPRGSRVLEFEQQVMAPAALGDVTLPSGVLLAGRVTDEMGQPVVGAIAEANGADPPFGFFFESPVDANGMWNGPVEFDGRFNFRISSERDDLADLYDFDEQGRDRIRYPSDELAPAGLIEGTVLDADSWMPLNDVSVSAFADAGGAPGPFSGSTRTCRAADGGSFVPRPGAPPGTDCAVMPEFCVFDTNFRDGVLDPGTYRMKLAAGSHFVTVFPDYGGDYLEAWYSPGTMADYCQQDAEPVAVPIGVTVGGVNVDLRLRSSISGTARFFGDPVPGATITITQGSLGSCFAFGFTDGSGNYLADRLPAGAGYRVEASAPPPVGGPPLCYDGEFDCSTFTPVTADPLTGVSGVDFQFGTAPPEVSEFMQLTVNPAGGGQLLITFENLPPEDFVDVYNVYTGTVGIFFAAVGTDCFIDPASLIDNLDGTFSYALAPGGGNEWYLVGASNTLGESSLGDGRVLSNACGASP